MKRLLLFVSLLSLVAMSARAQGRRVLVEEFTSSTCPPCAATDPIMEAFEAADYDKICVLKWHQRFPPPGNDPFYATYPDGEKRMSYYGINAIPAVVINGNRQFNPGKGLAFIEDTVGTVYSAMTDNYTISVRQQQTPDSLIAFVTVTTAAGITNPTDLKLGAVAAERYYGYQGTNGRPYHTSIAQAAMPPLATSGSLSLSFTQAAGTTQTYRFGTKINAKWDRTQLMVVAFLQSAGTVGVSKKEVYASGWTVPAVSVEASAGTGMIVGSGKNTSFKLTNHSSAPVSVTAQAVASKAPAGWTFTLQGAGSGIVLAPGESKDIAVTANTTGATLGNTDLSFTFSTADSIGIGGVKGYALGKDNKDIVVNATGGTTNVTTFTKSLKAAGADTVSFDYGSLLLYYPDFSNFRNVYWMGGSTTGIYSNVGAWESLLPFVNGGGNVLVASPVMVGAYANSGDETLIDEVRQLIKVDPQGYIANSSWETLTGVTGDPVSNGYNTSLVSGAISNEGALYTTDSSVAIFRNENENVVGVRTVPSAGQGKVVYLSFAPEQVAVTADRNALTKRIYDYFMGVASDVRPLDGKSAMLEQNFPNPFTSATSIGYSIPERSFVTIEVRDMLGRPVTKLVNQTQDAGPHTVKFDGVSLANGTYVYTLTAGGYKTDGKMTVNH